LTRSNIYVLIFKQINQFTQKPWYRKKKTQRRRINQVGR